MENIGHYVLVLLIIIVIVIIQFNSFFSNLRKMKVFKKVFSEKSRNVDNEIRKIENEYQQKIQEIEELNDRQLDELLREKDINADDYYAESPIGDLFFQKYNAVSTLKELILNEKNAVISKLSSFTKSSQNPIFSIIENSIQDYVNANKGGVSDFHIMKDIVDRNCDAQEEEIQAQIPVPLYLGLVGTMAGILVGILYLWLSGGLRDLLTGGETGAEGVEALLGGVAIAMVSSILGIILTTRSSLVFKNTKRVLEREKHSYLSKLQTELLPTLSDNIAGAIREMSVILPEFNNVFSSHIGNFDSTLGKVNETTRLQKDVLDAVKGIADKDLPTKNVELFTALKNSTNEISNLVEYLKSCNDYLANVKVLNEKLDGYEKRTQIIEQAGKFFSKNEKILAENFDAATIETQNALKRFNERIEDTLKKLSESLDRQTLNFNDVIERQYSVLVGKTKAFDKVVEELIALSAIKDSISKFEGATKEQNKKIDRLAENIEKLAQVKAGGGAVSPLTMLPKWVKITGVTVGCIISLAGLSYLIPEMIKWISELIKLL